MLFKYIALDTTEVEALRAGEPDDNGRSPEKSISDGNGNPCRHCLNEIPEAAPMLIRGYDSNERIVYGSGKVVQMKCLEAEAQRLFEDQNLSYIHVRSATNNCYHFRIES